ncbi:IclR family transcriptional regulator [Verticiella alkaliphila]|uniref:IclR family transcriptional regulator n=1 Tax=Verticiella alkaliphila TaxID=2779529 RepID=UPI0035304091
MDRALGLLQAVAASHLEGIGVRALAEQMNLDRTTAYRLMSSLVASGFVERDARRNYRLGLQAMQLGLAAMNRAPLVEMCRPMMLRLARLTEDTVFLVVRNGDYAHCIHCEEGAFPVKAMVLQIGGMRVLGIGSAGMTLLAQLADEQIEAIYTRRQDEFTPRGITLAALRRLVLDTRQKRYSATLGLVTEGVGGVGMGFDLPQGGHAAISIAAIAPRMQPDRRVWIAEQIAAELRAIGLSPSMRGEAA